MEQITSPSLNLYDLANIFNAYTDSDNITLYNLYNTINISGDIDPILYTEIYVTDSDDWFSLSYKYYGTTYLWWIILTVNGIDNPLEPLPTNKIKILNSSTVTSILTQMNNQ